MYIVSPKRIYLVTGSLYPLTTFTLPNPILAITNLLSISMSLFFFFLDLMYETM